jgi:hypothetical protein
LQEELTRTGVELPEFRKLGGMLSDDGGANRGKSEAIFQGTVRTYVIFLSFSIRQRKDQGFGSGSGFS